MTTARDLVNAIQSGKSATIQATFDSLMTEKIQFGIESYRQAVIDNTFNPELAESTEEEDADDSSINELSKETLSDYAKKAVDKVGMHAYAAGANSSKDQYKTAVKRIQGAQKAIGKMANKDSLVAHITGKNESEDLQLEDYSLEEIQEFMESEDFETLDELSKSTLASYVNKASQDAAYRDRLSANAHKAAQKVKFKTRADKDQMIDRAEKYSQKSDSRRAGIKKAVNKLTK